MKILTRRPKTETAHLDNMMIALATPTLEGLSYALRHPETWPPGFYWDYRDTCHCGLGLIHELWDQKIPKEKGVFTEPYLSKACHILALGYSAGYDMFVGTKGYGDIPCSKVMPEMVADKIDAYLAKRDA